MYIKLMVKANSKKEEIIEKSPDRFEVKVREKAERNMANQRILEIFRKKFITKCVRIISGHTSSSKIISVD